MSDELIISLAFIGFGTVAVVGLFIVWIKIVKAILKIGGYRGD